MKTTSTMWPTAMYDKLERICVVLLTSIGGRNRFVGLVTFLFIFVSLLGLVLLRGQYPVTLFPQDAMYALAQGDYLVKGLRPYVDYFCFHGPFPASFTAAGIRVHGISLEAVVLAQVLAAALFAPLMWKAASSRVHWAWALILAVSVEFLLLSSTPLGRKSWREFTPAMWYNALSFSMLGILYVCALLPSRSESRLSRWTDSVIAALCLTGVFYTKMSFFPPVLAVYLAGTVIWPRGRAMRLHGLAAVCLAVPMIFLFAWAFEVSLTGYFGFLQSIAMRFNPLAFALRYIHYTRTLGLFIVAIVLICALVHDGRLWRETRREWVMAVLMTGALIAIVGTCMQSPESLPLIGIVPLGLAVTTGNLSQEHGRPANARLAVPLVLASLMLVVNEPKNGALSLAFSQMKVTTPTAPVEFMPLGSSQAAKLPLGDSVDRSLFNHMPKSWVNETFAALALLREAGPPSDAVLFVATDANGITCLTPFRNAHGESPWAPFAWAADPRQVPPPVGHYLEDVDLILRDHAEPRAWDHLTHFRGAFVNDNFRQVGRNEHWTLYARKGTPLLHE